MSNAAALGGTGGGQASSARPRSHRSLLSRLGTGRKRKKAVSRAINPIQVLLATAATLATDTGVPVLSGGLKLLSEILQKVQEMSVTIEEITNLNERLQRLYGMVVEIANSEPSHSQRIRGEFKKMVNGMIVTWVEVGGKLNGIKSQGRLARFFGSQANSAEVSHLINVINTSLQDFMASVTVHSMMGIARIEERIVDMSHAEQRLPPCAAKASHNAVNARSGCLKDTRKQILERLRNWVEVACTQKDVLLAGNYKNIYWISGFAGTGKTTIAYSIVEWCERRGFPGGNFFCWHLDAECRNPGFIFTTISRQLCGFNPFYKQKVIEALRRDPSVRRSDISPSRQFEKLIVRPLEELKAEGKSFTGVIVIDGLDKCDDSQPISTILTILMNFAPRIAGFLVFIITSRPEPRFIALFEGGHRQSLSGMTNPLALHMERLDVVLPDIKLYFVDAFRETPSPYMVDDDWPSDQDLTILAELSEGRFNWAANARSFIMDEEFSNPQEQLELLTSSKKTPDRIQNALYDDILKAVLVKNTKESLRRHIRIILGVIATMLKPLSLDALTGLTGCSVSEVSNALNGLRSILHLPKDPSEPILIIHSTFPEYIRKASTAQLWTAALGLEERLGLEDGCLADWRAPLDFGGP